MNIGKKLLTKSFNIYSYIIIITNMDVMTDKSIKTKKLRLITSSLIIALSIILLIYAIINDESIVILIVFILIIKIIDLILNLQRIMFKKTSISTLKTERTERYETRYG